MVVGVSNESKGVVEKFIADKGVKYPIAIDPPAGSAYGVRAIPDALLVGADGRVVWTGHPAGLKEAEIEQSLQKVTFIPPLPERHAKYNATLRQRKFGKAYLDIKKATTEGKIKTEEAQPTLAGMEARMKGLLEESEKSRGEGDFYTAGKSLHELKIAFAGTDEAKKAADRLKELEKDQKARDQIKAVETLEKLELAMDSKSYADAYRGYHGLIKKFPGTKIEKIAGEKVAMIDKEKLLNYRANCPACKKEGKTCNRHRA